MTHGPYSFSLSLIEPSGSDACDQRDGRLGTEWSQGRFDKIISRGDAHDLVPKGEVEFVSGNHVSTYAARAKGDTWQYLGQTVSKNNLFLITRPDTGINKLEDVRKRKFGNRGRHPGLNTWLYLKQSGLNPDKDQVELVNGEARGR